MGKVDVTNVVERYRQALGSYSPILELRGIWGIGVQGCGIQIATLSARMITSRH